MEPASIRFKNPGAMWGNALAKKWGSHQTVVLHDGLGQGNNIAVFDTFVQGISAQLDLWRTSKNYRNKRFADAIAIWSGHNNVESYIHFVMSHVPGMTRDTIMNDAFWKSPMGIGFLKAQAGHEAGKTYPAEEEDWHEAQRRVFNESPAVEAKPVKNVVVGTATSATATWQMYINNVEPWIVGVLSFAIALAILYILYHLSHTTQGQIIMSKIKAFFASAWDWTKRIFGRSKTIFLNVAGIFGALWVEFADVVSGVNFDDLFKHEVAAAIGIIVQLLNIVIRYNTTGPVSFKQLEEVDVPVVTAPVAAIPVVPPIVAAAPAVEVKAS